jgi:hypothetical protein
MTMPIPSGPIGPLRQRLIGNMNARSNPSRHQSVAARQFIG